MHTHTYIYINTYIIWCKVYYTKNLSVSFKEYYIMEFCKFSGLKLMLNLLYSWKNIFFPFLCTG